jgi:hypothetical protein
VDWIKSWIGLKLGILPFYRFARPIACAVKTREDIAVAAHGDYADECVAVEHSGAEHTDEDGDGAYDAKGKHEVFRVSACFSFLVQSILELF